MSIQSSAQSINPSPLFTILGCMSGTSLDGIDLAILKTDGEMIIETAKTYYHPYAQDQKNKIAKAFMKDEFDDDVRLAELIVTESHINAIRKFIAQDNISFDYIGFHGQTITHDPVQKFTWQIGDAKKIASEFNVPVIYDFRTNDVDHGGQGAPLLPVYHRALIQDSNLELPTVIINIGGVSNITYLSDTDLIAFDCGAGNALMDSVMQSEFQKPFDENGEIARIGMVNHKIIDELLSDKFFELLPPKSLDRNPWKLEPLHNLDPKDRVATLLEFTIKGIEKGIALLPEPPNHIFITGGGRNNSYLMQLLIERLPSPVRSVDELGWNGDFIEAQGFAYMAARHLKSLPISFSGTTGVKTPLSGGKLTK
jgi:anhydro-N-acetylmuramic acid kinase